MRGVTQTVRVCVGTEPRTEIARRVLECSITRRTEARIEFHLLSGKAWEYDHGGVPVGTGFSLRRWMIPAHFGWEGRAVYLDADQLVLGDVAELWRMPEIDPQPSGCSAWATWQPDRTNPSPWPQASVMVIDCAAARAQWGWHLGRVLDHLRSGTTKTYHRFMHCTWMQPAPGVMPTPWNHLDVLHPDTKLLHYTSVPSQPWIDPAHPQARHWQLELSAAINGGFITRRLLKGALAAWQAKAAPREQEGIHPEYARYLEGCKD